MNYPYGLDPCAPWGWVGVDFGPYHCVVKKFTSKSYYICNEGSNIFLRLLEVEFSAAQRLLFFDKLHSLTSQLSLVCTDFTIFSKRA